MKTADLYIRVSTDEQADKGYSQRNQEEVLRKYCTANNIVARTVIYEDHSAKSFNRPEWVKLLACLRKYRNKTELILFTKWDRFSRNAPDAYQMINILRKLGVEPQAIEQPLDMSVPENKMMLAIYLTAPEIENDRRALNVFYGMRRARKEGRYMATAPVGYVNHIMEGGIKRIIPDEPQASIMKWAFNEIRKNKYTIEQIWKRAKELGLKCNKNNFWVAIRNPLYCGKIVIPKYKDEETYTVPGLHEPIISESLYHEVQEVLEGRRRWQDKGTKIVSMDMLPLRGFLNCSACSRTLSGSASKGRTQYYHYYHCSSICGYRQKAEDVNETFVSGLKEYILNPLATDLFKAVIIDAYSNASQNVRINKKQYIDQITVATNKLTKARELLLNGDLDASDYKIIKTESEHQVEVLEAKISDLNKDFIKPQDLATIVDGAIDTLTKIDVIYWKSEPDTKRKIIGSIYKEKFTFEDLQHRTASLTDPFKFTYLINKQLNEIKSGTTNQDLVLSRWVIPSGFEPETY
ncbi:recombinase family protein [Mucilaginibacter sp. E4BP6]|uniref:recombinase family protein n=1 Tax=Mucilaginibacter sp. E4BP6 TaxID=2723089 RepID=UPI0015C9A069|nr:recombinase family protein [Mucilaginibacter sp. E4BP6]